VNSPLASPAAPPPFCPISLSSFSLIQKPEAALVSFRNQPRADNNEIHKSVREHAEYSVLSRPGTSPLLCPSLVSSPSTSRIVYPRACYLSRSVSLRFRDPRLNLIASENVFMTLRETESHAYISPSLGVRQWYHKMRLELHRRSSQQKDFQKGNYLPISRKLIIVQRVIWLNIRTKFN